MPNVRLWIVCLACLSAVACGDDTSGDGSGAGSSTGDDMSTTGAMTTASMETTGGSSGDTAASSDGRDTEADSTGNSTGSMETGDTGDTGGSTGGSTGATTSGSSGDGGMAMVDASMSGLQIFQDCMPIVSPDPVGVSFALDLENLGTSEVTLDVVSATFSDAGGDVGTIELTPSSFGPIEDGETLSMMVSKTINSLMPANGCGVVMCNQQYTLTVDFVADDGTEISADASGQVDCVF